MSSLIARRALLRTAAIPVSSSRTFSTTFRRFASADSAELQKESKRNPELFILAGVMVCALGGAGYYFGRSPTTSTSESKVALADMPWQSEGQGKYRYHPGADPKQSPKDAPSAINVTIIPDVVLPKHLHDTWNKFGKDDS